MLQMALGASAALPSAILHQELQPLLPGPDKTWHVLKSGNRQVCGLCLENPWQSVSQFSVQSYQTRLLSTNKRPILIDGQDSHPDSVLFSYGIAEQCTRHEKILQFLMSGSTIVEEDGLNISLLSDLMGFHRLTIDMHPQLVVPLDEELSPYEFTSNDSHSSIPRDRLFYCPRTILDFFGDMSHNSSIMAHPNRLVLFQGTEAEMKDLLSRFSAFYQSKVKINGSKQSMVVPYFRRWGKAARANNHGLSGSQTQIVAPQKRPDTVKLRSSQKKKKRSQSSNTGDLDMKGYFQACEALLSFIVDKNGSKTSVLSLKKSSPEISKFLTQFSAGIAGTGLAVLFSVVYKVTSGRVPFCTTKLLNTGFGFGLFWLSSAVNCLRDTIIHISKNSSRLSLKEEDISWKVEQSVKLVLLRAAALMAVVALRFA